MPDKIVTIYLTRHAQSTWNYIHANGIQIDNAKMKNSALSTSGFESIVLHRQSKLKHNIDYIFTSPLKRAIETCLLTYNTVDTKNPIYVTPFLVEHSDTIDCAGISVDEMKTDVDILTYRNYKKLDYETYFPKDENKDWSNINFRMDSDKRVADFLKILSSDKFTNKTVGVFSHHNFIAHFTGLYIENYKTIRFKYDQDTHAIFDKEIV